MDSKPRRLPYGPPANTSFKFKGCKEDQWEGIQAWNRVKSLCISKKEKIKYVRRMIMIARERRKKMGILGEIANVDRKDIPQMLECLTDDLNRLKAEEEISNFVFAGSYRRMSETVNDIDIIITTETHEYGWGPILNTISESKCVKKIASIGTKKATIILDSGLQVDLLMAKPEEEGTMLLYFTGSPFFNIALRARAKKMGLKLNERGLYDETDRLVTRCNTETVILAELGLEYIPASERSVDHTDWSTAHKLFARHKLKKD